MRRDDMKRVGAAWVTRRAGSASWVVSLAVAHLSVGCAEPARTPSPTSRPATATSAPASRSQRAVRTVLAAEANEWTAEECLANLDDEELAVAAAVRLVRLSGRACLAVPADLDESGAAELRVARLGDGAHALGIRSADRPRALRAPVFIDAHGSVREMRVSSTQPASGENPAESAGAASDSEAVLVVSESSELFPHLVLACRTVFLAGATEKPALSLRKPATLCLDVRTGDGFDYLALLWRAGEGEETEVARYLWDPFELRFSGPASDKLPIPPGGRFEFDLENSGALLPVGGEIPAPDPLKPAIETPREPS